MGKIHRDNSFVLHGWMVTELHLKDTELIVYAIIYGFSQTSGQAYLNGKQYLMDWTGSSEATIRRTLKRLIKNGLITRISVPGSVDRLKAIRPAPVNLTTPTPVKMTTPTPVNLTTPPPSNCNPTPVNLTPPPLNISDKLSGLNQSFSQSETSNNHSTVESVETSEGKKEGFQSKRKKRTYNDMLQAIGSPLADTGITSEDKLADYDERMRRTAECTLPIEIKLNKSMFRQALQYLMAYSYRMPEAGEDVKNFTDTVINNLVDAAYYGSYNGHSASYEYILDNLNDINRSSSLADWMLAFYDEWKAHLEENPPKNPPAYLRSWCYRQLQDHKIKSITADPF